MEKISHCEHCDELFIPKMSGAESILCRKCSMDAEEVYLPVRKYVQENEDHSLEAIAEKTRYPEPLIKALILDGRFEISSDITPRRPRTSDDETQRRQALVQELQETRLELQGFVQSTSTKPVGGSGRSYGLGR